MSSSGLYEIQNNELQTEIVFEAKRQISNIDLPVSNWPSLDVSVQETNRKRLLQDAGLYCPGSGEICAKTIAFSNSSMLRNKYYNYPPVEDPGINEALLAPEMPVNFGDDGQRIYLALCKEMNICPVRLFYRGLVTPDINISYYGLNPLGIRPMAMALQNNRFVEKLNLTANYLNDDACYHLGEMLNTNVTLRELNMTGCRIGPTGLFRLGINLHINRILKTLNLAGNNIGEEGGVFYAEMIMKGVTINRINLSKNGLGRQTADAFVEVFTFIDKVTHLDLSLNNFYQTPSTAKMLASLSYSSILQELNLAWNALEGNHGNQGNHVARSINNLMLIPTLTILDLSNNRFSGEAISIIVERLYKAKKLVTLDLSFNPLSTGDALTALEKMLRPGVKLKNLFMANVWVDQTFNLVLDIVKRMKCRQDFMVTFEGVLGNWTLEDVDARALVLKRADYLGQSGKYKVNLVQFFLNVNKETHNMGLKDFMDRVSAHCIPLDEGLVEELAVVFPGDKSAEPKCISLESICEYVKRIWPERMEPKVLKPRPSNPPKIKTNKVKSKKG